MDKNIENNPMNHNIFAEQWKQMRVRLKSWWGKLTDDAFESIEGQKNKLIGLVQEKYGYTRDRAQEEHGCLRAEADQAQQRRRAGQPVDQPARRQPRHPRADQRNRLSGEEQPVIAGVESAQKQGGAGHLT